METKPTLKVSKEQSILSTPLTLPCGVIIPNRLCKSAMTEALADDWGRPTERLCRLYNRWAQGGTGLLLTGNIQIDRRYIERPGNVCIDGEQDEEQLRQLRAFAKSGQLNGTKIFAQISHGGRQSNGMINMSPVSPGNVRLELPAAYFGTPTPLSIEDIQDVKERFIHAAKVCKACGFDGVQIHSAHGYLLSSFLNPRANNRPEIFGDSDPYGGSLENRARLLLEVVRGVRKEVGNDYPISVKLNSADFQEGGFSPEEAVQVAILLDREGIDLLEISGGNYEAGIYEETATKHEQKHVRESTKKREAYFLSYAIEVKNAIHNTPTLVTGGWRSCKNMENAIQDNECALIGLGRPLCGDPDGSKKLLSGEIEELPRYEKKLRTLHWSLQWVYYMPFQMLHLMNVMSQQSWYFRQLVSIADTGEPNHSLGCFASFLANASHEQELARNIKGNVNCVGSIYKGPQTGSG